MGDRGNTPVREKFHDSRELFVLKYNNGYMFFEVESWSETTFEPYTGLGEIGPNTNSGWSRLEDDDGDDILYIEHGEEVVLHAGIGQSPAQLQRYTNYPESENRLRTLPNLSTPSPRSGDDYGAVDGNDSPYNMPTDSEELYIPPSVHLDFDFYNPSSESIEPKLNMVIRQYNVNVIEPREKQDLVRRAMNPGSPIPISPVGSATNQKDVTRRNWDIDPVNRNEIDQIINRE